MLSPDSRLIMTAPDAVNADPSEATVVAAVTSSLLGSPGVKLSVLDALAAHIAVIDLDGMILEVNEPWRLFASTNGLQHNEIPPKTGVGTNYLAVCGASGDATQAMSPAYEGIQSVLRGTVQRFSFEYPCHSPTEERWFEMCVMPVGQPKPMGAVIAHTNISEHRRLSQALHAKNTELEQARTAADTANRAKSEFLSGMSHELRTPLGAILGFAQLIETGSPLPTAGQQRSVDQILKAGWYQLGLIDQILDLALVESGKLALATQTVNLAPLLGECEAMLEALAAERGVSLTVNALPCAFWFQADPMRLKQVLVNLLSNAIKYNRPDGSVVVDCQVTQPGLLRIAITDTGHGLNAEQIRQLFQPFNRLGQEAGSEQGTGIGLLMTKRLTELMGGAIGLQSTPGQGSVFWVEFSLSEADPERTAEPVAETPSTLLLNPVLQVRTVLYVEDNLASQALVGQLLARRPDLRMQSARDGQTGLAMARALLPDLILLDINLPGLTGSQVLAHLKQDPATAHIPVLALSANAMPHDIRGGKDAGFAHYLTKPIRIDDFMAALDKAMPLCPPAASTVFSPVPPVEIST